MTTAAVIDRVFDVLDGTLDIAPATGSEDTHIAYAQNDGDIDPAYC